MILTNIRLLVGDFSACFKFYQDIIGLVPTWGSAEENYATFQIANEVMLSLLKIRSSQDHKPSDQDKVIMIYGVNDLEETYKDLKAKGVSFVREPHDSPGFGIRLAHFRDPEGNLIEIYSDLPKND